MPWLLSILDDMSKPITIPFSARSRPLDLVRSSTARPVHGLAQSLHPTHLSVVFNMLTLSECHLKDTVWNAYAICVWPIAHQSSIHVTLAESFTPHWQVHEVVPEPINQSWKVVVDLKIPAEVGKLVAASKAINPHEHLIEFGDLAGWGGVGDLCSVGMVRLEDLAVAILVLSRADVRWEESGWRRPGAVPCVACREVVVGLVYATVHATDDCLRWASSHCARTFATANSDLPRPQAPAQPKPAQRSIFILLICGLFSQDQNDCFPIWVNINRRK